MLKRYLIAGLLIWVPLVVTAWVLMLFVNSLDQILNLLPSSLHPHSWLGRSIPGLGVILTLVILLLSGMLATNIIGARLLNWWERVLQRIPVVKSIYTSVKQVSDTLFSPNGNAFRQAVLIEYPRKGLWTIAFLTGKADVELSKNISSDSEVVSVYVPTTPNPTSGFFLLLAANEIHPCNMSIDEALKYVISMGVVLPRSSSNEKII